MKKNVFILFLFIGTWVLSNTSYAATLPADNTAPGKEKSPREMLNEMLTKQFLRFTPKKYFALTGKKMTLSQKI